MFLMLNPSTADETADDPTVTKCQRYARRWGYGGAYICNLFGYRSTHPAIMKLAADPVGPGNDAAILSTAKTCALSICAWGNHGAYLNRSEQVLQLLRSHGAPLHCLKLNKTGEPQHPLYLKNSLEPIMFGD